MSNQRPYDGYRADRRDSASANDAAGRKLTPAAPLTPGRRTRASQDAGAPGFAVPPPTAWEEADELPNEPAPRPRAAWSAADYTPNEPAPRPRAAWNAADYTPNEPAPRPRAAWSAADYTPNEPAPRPRAAWNVPQEDPYTPEDAQAYDPTNNPAAWDGTETDADPAGFAQADPYGAAFAEDEDPPAYAQDVDWAPDAALPAAPMRSGQAQNPYSRPPADSPDGVPDLSAKFAPPLKFERSRPQPADPRDPGESRAEPYVYQTRRPLTPGSATAGFDPLARADAYHVQQERRPARRGRRSTHALRRWLTALCILAVLGGAAYVGRDWILTQLRVLLGNEAVESVQQAMEGETAAVAGYDPAPSLKAGDIALHGIEAVAGDAGLMPYAVTAKNIIQRSQRADGTYDYYLFASGNGKLLGYYEGIGDNGFLVCPDDVYAIDQPPYLIDDTGRALIDPSRYRDAAGEDAVLGPIINGWSVIRNAEGTSFNFINAEGTLFTTLWFSKVFPFTANRTLAYVDTGNVTNAEERYALYELTRTGEMKLWRHAPDMAEVLGCAAGVAVLADGSVVRLDGTHAVLCATDEALIYADCGALVARDPKTDLYGLFVNGEQHYDFAYDRIAPVPSDIVWNEAENGLCRSLTVTGRAYPLPLSHYFALQKSAAQELVALSTASVYPLPLSLGM